MSRLEVLGAVSSVAAKLARFSWLPGGLAAVLVIAVGRLVYSTSSAPLELAVYDRMMRSVEVGGSHDVVILAIDQESLNRLGEWPWSRDVHADALDRLNAAGAAVVTFTVPFDTARGASEQERVRAALALLEQSNLGDSEQARQLRKLLGGRAGGRDPNTHLAQAVAAHGNVVLPVDVRIDYAVDAGEIPEKFAPNADPSVLTRATRASIAQLPADVFLQAASALGHNYQQADADGIVRTDIAAIHASGGLVPSLATATVARALGVAPSEIAFHSTDALTMGDRKVPLDSRLRDRPHFFPPADAGMNGRSFQQYPYWQVLSGEVGSDQLEGKIVVIGFVNDDRIATPVSAATPPVVALASSVSSLLDGRMYSQPRYASGIEWLIALVVVLYAAFALPAAGTVIGAMTTVLLVVVLAGTEVMLLRSSQLWMRFMLPSGALICAYGLYLVGDLIRRANTRTEPARDPAGNLRSLGQTFQKQGQLDLAFETYQRCPLDAPTMEQLYFLGMDFERRHQPHKASAVYDYIATRDPNYRDLKARRTRAHEEATAPDMPSPARAGGLPATRPAATPRVADDDDDLGLDLPRYRSQPSPSQIARDPVTRPAATRAPGTRALGRYEIERELGKGAMGIVYLGRDPKINRVVAIKAIPLAEEFEEDDLSEARARFFREAEMAGRLNHPAIVTVYDAGEDQGLAYIAMEYLRGQHLSHYTESKHLLPPKTVMLLVARVADALHYAHRQNVVHRDIKPANIMFSPDTDELKITDFGIARLTDTSRTKTGIVLGTPSFMSPEQLEGRTLDGRSDQFALGVSFYQLLCGQLPFRAESMPRLMHKIATEPHTPIRLVRPDLDPAIEPIIDRVLSKSADDRYVTCAELGAALRAVAGPQERPAAEPEHEWLLP